MYFIIKKIKNLIKIKKNNQKIKKLSILGFILKIIVLLCTIYSFTFLLIYFNLMFMNFSQFFNFVNILENKQYFITKLIIQKLLKIPLLFYCFENQNISTLSYNNVWYNYKQIILTLQKLMNYLIYNNLYLQKFNINKIIILLILIFFLKNKKYNKILFLWNLLIFYLKNIKFWLNFTNIILKLNYYNQLLILGILKKKINITFLLKIPINNIIIHIWNNYLLFFKNKIFNFLIKILINLIINIKNFFIYKNFNFYKFLSIILFLKKFKRNLIIPLFEIVYNFYIKIALPLRIFIRLLVLITQISIGLFLIIWHDFILFLKNIIIFLKYNIKNLFFRLEFMIFIIALYIIISKLHLFFYIDNSVWGNLFDYHLLFFKIWKFENLNLSPIITSLLILILIAEIGSLYYSTISIKKILYGTYYLILFSYLLLYWLFFEYTTISIFFLQNNGLVLVFLYIFRTLREDHRMLLNFQINPYSYKKINTLFQINKYHAIFFKFGNLIIGFISEIIIYLLIILSLFFLLSDYKFIFVNSSILNWGLTETQTIFLILFIIIRQSTYSYFIWLLIFCYILIWSVFTTLILTLTNFSHFGLITDNLINETTALSSFGLLNSSYGFEKLMLFKNNGYFFWYFGESFINKVEQKSNIGQQELFNFTNVPFNVFGDMFILPYAFTSHDDHNWTIVETLENNYFNTTKLIKTISESLNGDVIKYWPLERNSYIWFGEFLENDLYYGWSHQIFIDTGTYFDYSPYALTNIFGDGLMRAIVTDIFTIFVGPVELDQSNLQNLNDWGANYTPGFRTNRVSGGEMSGFENSSMLDKEQRMRENGESFHEWFPGFYVLDGKIDVKHAIFFLRLFIFILLPIFTITVWLTILGKPSIGLDENFGEMEMANFNFFFFGNEQVETFTTYYWNNIYTTNYEWSNDTNISDPIAYEPTSNLFEEVFKNVSTGLFNFSILDSFFYLPILKHTEGYSSTTWKDFVMPILFPTGNDTNSAIAEDYSLFFENIKKISENSKNKSNILENWNLDNLVTLRLKKEMIGGVFLENYSPEIEKDIPKWLYEEDNNKGNLFTYRKERRRLKLFNQKLGQKFEIKSNAKLWNEFILKFRKYYFFKKKEKWNNQEGRKQNTIYIGINFFRRENNLPNYIPNVIDFRRFKKTKNNPKNNVKVMFNYAWNRTLYFEKLSEVNFKNFIECFLIKFGKTKINIKKLKKLYKIISEFINFKKNYKKILYLNAFIPFKKKISKNSLVLIKNIATFLQVPFNYKLKKHLSKIIINVKKQDNSIPIYSVNHFAFKFEANLLKKLIKPLLTKLEKIYISEILKLQKYKSQLIVYKKRNKKKTIQGLNDIEHNNNIRNYLEEILAEYQKNKSKFNNIENSEEIIRKFLKGIKKIHFENSLIWIFKKYNKGIEILKNHSKKLDLLVTELECLRVACVGNDNMLKNFLTEGVKHILWQFIINNDKKNKDYNNINIDKFKTKFLRLLKKNLIKNYNISKKNKIQLFDFYFILEKLIMKYCFNQNISFSNKLGWSKSSIIFKNILSDVDFDYKLLKYNNNHLNLILKKKKISNRDRLIKYKHMYKILKNSKIKLINNNKLNFNKKRQKFFDYLKISKNKSKIYKIPLNKLELNSKYYYENLNERSKFYGSDLNIKKYSDINKILKLFKNKDLTKINKIGGFEQAIIENYNNFGHNYVKTRRKLKQRQTTLQGIINKNNYKELEYAQFENNSKHTNDLGMQMLNKVTDIANNNVNFEDIDLNIFVKNQFDNDILANAVAYETNLEYSNLFESLILEMISPGNHRYRDLEYEFESSNPGFSTISEFADPEGNYAESGLFENDSIIDDPITESMFEMPGNDNYVEEMWNGAWFKEEGEGGFRTTYWNETRLANNNKAQETESDSKDSDEFDIIGKELGTSNTLFGDIFINFAADDNFFWTNIKLPYLGNENFEDENDIIGNTALYYHRGNQGVVKKKNYFTNNQNLWNPGLTQVRFNQPFLKFFERKKRKRFDAFNFQKNLVFQKSKNFKFFRTWVPTLDSLRKLQLREILEEKFVRLKLNKKKYPNNLDFNNLKIIKNNWSLNIKRYWMFLLNKSLSYLNINLKNFIKNYSTIDELFFFKKFERSWLTNIGNITSLSYYFNLNNINILQLKTKSKIISKNMFLTKNSIFFKNIIKNFFIFKVINKKIIYNNSKGLRKSWVWKLFNIFKKNNNIFKNNKIFSFYIKKIKINDISKYSKNKYNMLSNFLNLNLNYFKFLNINKPIYLLELKKINIKKIWLPLILDTFQFLKKNNIYYKIWTKYKTISLFIKKKTNIKYLRKFNSFFFKKMNLNYINSNKFYFYKNLIYNKNLYNIKSIFTITIFIKKNKILKKKLNLIVKKKSKKYKKNIPKIFKILIIFKIVCNYFFKKNKKIKKIISEIIFGFILLILPLFNFYIRSNIKIKNYLNFLYKNKVLINLYSIQKPIKIKNILNLIKILINILVLNIIIIGYFTVLLQLKNLKLIKFELYFYKLLQKYKNLYDKLIYKKPTSSFIIINLKSLNIFNYHNMYLPYSFKSLICLLVKLENKFLPFTIKKIKNQILKYKNYLRVYLWLLKLKKLEILLIKNYKILNNWKIKHIHIILKISKIYLILKLLKKIIKILPIFLEKIIKKPMFIYKISNKINKILWIKKINKRKKINKKLKNLMNKNNNNNINLFFKKNKKHSFLFYQKIKEFSDNLYIREILEISRKKLIKKNWYLILKNKIQEFTIDINYSKKNEYLDFKKQKYLKFYDLSNFYNDYLNIFLNMLGNDVLETLYNSMLYNGNTWRYTFWKNYHKLNIKKITKKLIIEKNVRNWLEKKYPQFKHRETLPIFFKNINDFNFNHNYYFYKDYTELCLKFIINNITWSFKNTIVSQNNTQLPLIGKILNYKPQINKSPIVDIFTKKKENFFLNMKLSLFFRKYYIKKYTNNIEFNNIFFSYNLNLNDNQINDILDRQTTISVTNLLNLKTNNINYDLNRYKELLWFKSTQNLKRLINLPEPTKLREYWIKSLFKITNLPTGIIKYLNETAIVNIFAIFNNILHKDRKYQINFKSLQTLVLHNIKKDDSFFWYKKYYLRQNKKIQNTHNLRNNIFGFEKISILNLTKLKNYEVVLDKIIWIRKIWKILKLSLFFEKYITGFLKKGNLFLIKFIQWKVKDYAYLKRIKIHNLHKIFKSNFNFKNTYEFQSNIYKYLNTKILIKYKNYYKINKFFFKNHIYLTKFFLNYYYKKIIKLLQLGFLCFRFSKHKIFKIIDLVWIQNIFLNTKNIINFKNNKLKKQIDYFKWKNIFFKTLKSKKSIQNNQLNLLFKILIRINNSLIINNNYIKLKQKLIRLNLLDIFKFTLSSLNKSLNLKDYSKIKIPIIVFVKNLKNSKIIENYNQDQTKDFLINVLFFWGREIRFSILKNLYTWLDTIFIDWKLQKIIIVKFRGILKLLLKTPYSKSNLFINSDFFLILNKIQPICLEDCLYYRDYTNIFLQKLIILIIKNKLNLHIIRKKNIDYLIDLISVQFFNRIYWLSWFKKTIKKKKILKIKYTGDLKKYIKKYKYQINKQNISEIQTILEPITKNKYNQILKNIEHNEINSKLVPERWQYSRRFETWTDSSETTLTSITYLEENAYQKNIALYKDAWENLRTFTDQFKSERDGFIGINDQPDLLDEFNYNTLHLESKFNNYIEFNSNEINSTNNYWNIYVDNNLLRDYSEIFPETNLKETDGTLLFNRMKKYNPVLSDNEESEESVLRINQNQLFNTILQLKVKTDWLSHRHEPVHFSNIIDHSLFYSTNYNMNTWAFSNIWDINNFEEDFQSNQILNAVDNFKGLSYFKAKYDGLGIENMEWEISETESTETTETIDYSSSVSIGEGVSETSAEGEGGYGFNLHHKLKKPNKIKVFGSDTNSENTTEISDLDKNFEWNTFNKKKFTPDVINFIKRRFWINKYIKHRDYIKWKNHAEKTLTPSKVNFNFFIEDSPENQQENFKNYSNYFNKQNKINNYLKFFDNFFFNKKIFQKFEDNQWYNNLYYYNRWISKGMYPPVIFIKNQLIKFFKKKNKNLQNNNFTNKQKQLISILKLYYKTIIVKIDFNKIHIFPITLQKKNYYKKNLIATNKQTIETLNKKQKIIQKIWPSRQKNNKIGVRFAKIPFIFQKFLKKSLFKLIPQIWNKEIKSYFSDHVIWLETAYIPYIKKKIKQNKINNNLIPYNFFIDNLKFTQVFRDYSEPWILQWVSRKFPGLIKKIPKNWDIIVYKNKNIPIKKLNKLPVLYKLEKPFKHINYKQSFKYNQKNLSLLSSLLLFYKYNPKNNYLVLNKDFWNFFDQIFQNFSNFEIIKNNIVIMKKLTILKNNKKLNNFFKKKKIKNKNWQKKKLEKKLANKNLIDFNTLNNLLSSWFKINNTKNKSFNDLNNWISPTFYYTNKLYTESIEDNLDLNFFWEDWELPYGTIHYNSSDEERSSDIDGGNFSDFENINDSILNFQIKDSTKPDKQITMSDYNSNQETQNIDRFRYQNQKKKLYLKDRYNKSDQNKHITKDIFYKIVPTYFDGSWSGSDSGQTILDYKRTSPNMDNIDYKVFNPIFGIFILNTKRLNFDLSKFGREFLENPWDLDFWINRIGDFISDHDTNFYDDRSIYIQNFWLFWLEFYRHLFITRWRLTLNYTNNVWNKDIKHKYPIGYTHELYWFKYLVFSRYIKNIVQKLIIPFSLKDFELRNKLKLNIKKKINYYLFLKLFLNFKNENKFIKDNLLVKYNWLIKNNWKKFKFGFKLLWNLKKKIKTSWFRTISNKFPNYAIGVISSDLNNVILFSKSLNQKNNKKSNGVISFLKPIRSYTSENYFQEDDFILDTETAIRNYIYCNNVIDDDFDGDMVENDYLSDSDTGNEYTGDYHKDFNFSLNKFFNNDLSTIAKANLATSETFDGFSSNIFGKNKFKKFDRLGKFRDVARKDSNLKYKRNWFFSNHILKDWTLLTSYTGNWLIFSEFEVDRQRSSIRNLKHGSKYRLNFNTELWWTRTEPLDTNFRRVDILEFDIDFGALDSDGEIFHLHKGLLDVAFLPENLEYTETVLPLFERSLLDPESPALNEDGEFPEFDLNVIYNTEITKRLNLTLNNNTNTINKSKKQKNNNLTETECDNFVKNIQDYGDINYTDYWDKKKHKSLEVGISNIDKFSNGFFDNQVNKEIDNLKFNFLKRKNRFNLGFIELDLYQKNYKYNFNQIDFGTVIDNISHKELHPISYTNENIYMDLIDQKIDEMLEYKTLTNSKNFQIFLNYQNINHFEKLNSFLDWREINLINETNLDVLENILGFDYELLLHKYSFNYWKIILEIDANWNNTYMGIMPQVNDSISNFENYLPIWNYDPAYWEIYGFDYENSPLINTDDSKLLLNSKISKFDSYYNWIAQKDLVNQGISINNLGWGGVDIVNGLANHIPYDFLYGSDDDSDFEIYGELFFFKNIEDKESYEMASSHLEYTQTRNSKWGEYPKNGFNLYEKKYRFFKDYMSFYLTQGLNTTETKRQIGDKRLHWWIRKDRRQRLKKKINFNPEYFKNTINKTQNLQISEDFDFHKKNYLIQNDGYSLDRGFTPDISRGIDYFRNNMYMLSTGSNVGKVNIISNTFWKSMLYFFLNKYNNKLIEKNSIYLSSRKKIKNLEKNIQNNKKSKLLELTKTFNIDIDNILNLNFIKNKQKKKLTEKIKNNINKNLKKKIIKNKIFFLKEIFLFEKFNKNFINKIVILKNQLIFYFINIIINQIFNIIFIKLKLKIKKLLKKKQYIIIKNKQNLIKVNQLFLYFKNLIKIKILTKLSILQLKLMFIISNININNYNQLNHLYFLFKNILKKSLKIKNNQINLNLLFSKINKYLFKSYKNIQIFWNQIIWIFIFNKKIKKNLKNNIWNYLNFFKLLKQIIWINNSKFKYLILLSIFLISDNFDKYYNKNNTIKLFIFLLGKNKINFLKKWKKFNNQNFNFKLKFWLLKHITYIKFIKILLIINKNNLIIIKKINKGLLKNNKFLFKNTLTISFSEQIFKNSKIKNYNFKNDINLKIFINLIENILFTKYIWFFISLKNYNHFNINWDLDKINLKYLPLIFIKKLKIFIKKINIINFFSTNLIIFIKILNKKKKNNYILKNITKKTFINFYYKKININKYFNFLLKNKQILNIPEILIINSLLRFIKTTVYFIIFRNISNYFENFYWKRQFNKVYKIFILFSSKNIKNKITKLEFNCNLNLIFICSNVILFKKIKSKLLIKTINIKYNEKTIHPLKIKFKKSNLLSQFKTIFTKKKSINLKKLNIAKLTYFQINKLFNNNNYKIINKKNLLKKYKWQNILKLQLKNYTKNNISWKLITNYYKLKILKGKLFKKLNYFQLKVYPFFSTKFSGDLKFDYKGIFEYKILKNNTLIKKFNQKINNNNLIWDWWEDFEDLSIESKDGLHFSYFTTNLQLGSKRGGIGDTSHWSSGTEYLNEQFNRMSTIFNFNYKINQTINRRNNKEFFHDDLISEHSNYKAEYQTFVDIDRFTEDPLKGYISSVNSEIIKNLMSDNLNPIDDFYDNDSDQGIAFEQFSYIDWGFDTDHDNLDSDLNFWQSEPHTGDIQRYASTESVYIDFIGYEYGRELREFPEEIGDWTISDFYSEVIDKFEISEIPNSTNESELYSIDSSNSISDYILGGDINSNLVQTTSHLSNEPSTDYEDPVFNNYKFGSSFYFDMFNKIKEIQNFESNITPNAHPEVDLFGAQIISTGNVNSSFDDFFKKSILESKRQENIYFRDWGDYNKLELEDTTREPEFFSKQQSYVDAFFIEAILDDLLINLNILKDSGEYLNITEYLNTPIMSKAISLRFILFTKTKYLLKYRTLLIDIGLANYLF